MRITLPWGTEQLAAEAPWLGAARVLDVAPAAPLRDLDAVVRDAFENPIGQSRSIFSRVAPGETVAIIVSDASRRTGIDRVLPALLEGLAEAGVRDSDIRFVFATGVHRAPTPGEMAVILGPAVARRFAGRLVAHDPFDPAGLVRLGTTSRGTPIDLNRVVCEADRLIATGSVVLHYFAGYGGGRKAILPGVAGQATIAANHSMTLHPTKDGLNPDVAIGRLDGNPVAEDMLEGARMRPADLLVNTVLNRDGETAALFAGDMEAAHLAACAMARELFVVPIDKRADLVVAASAGTRNFLQTHKALFNAFQAVRPDGRVVLAAPCPEGLGNERFTKWLALGEPARVISALRQNAEINGQTALSTLGKTPRTTMVTELDNADAALLGVTRAPGLENALAAARPLLPDNPSCYVMPHAACTVPMARED